jgi:hypothetical protein
MPPLPFCNAGLAWRRFQDDTTKPPVAMPVQTCRPKSLAEIIAIVEDAESEADPNLELRACGSHWAFSEAAVTQGYMVETTVYPNSVAAGDPDVKDQPWLNSSLFEVIPGCLSQSAREFFSSKQGVTAFNPVAPPVHSQFYLYHVEAGTRIWELYCRLDEGDDSVKGSLADQMDQYKGPWAMETLGGAGGQTIVGAISTGTHGGDVHLSPIADAVQAIHLVGPGGKQYWFETLSPHYSALVDDDKLTKLYGKIEIVRDPDRFKAVLVAAGRMGIIYSVVLRVVRQYALREVTTPTTWSSVKAWISNPADPIFKNNRFVQVFINPNPRLKFDDDHTCYVTLRKLDSLDKSVLPGNTEPYGRKERRFMPNAGNSNQLGEGPSSFNSLICASDAPVRAAFELVMLDVANAINAILDASADVAKYTAMEVVFPTPYTDFLLSAAIAEAATYGGLLIIMQLFWLTVPYGPLPTTLVLIAEWCAVTDHIEIFRRIAEAALADQNKPRVSPYPGATDLCGISYAVMDIHNYLDHGCEVNGDSLEVFFDAASPNLVVFVERLFQRIKEVENGTLAGLTGHHAFPGYVAVRFMGKSSALLAMQRFNTTCSLEVAGFTLAPSTEPFLSTIEQDAIGLGGTIHWGQRNDLTMKEVEQMYDPAGDLYLWRKALSAITDNGRLALFSTQFTRKRGLEVVQPIVQAFSVSPSYGCAGSSVQIAWTAAANPPGTVASLEVRPSNWSGPSPPTTTIHLSDLNGSQAVTLPAGLSDFTLVATTTLNGRPVPADPPRKLQVQGFSDHEKWTILRSGECMSINGRWRWGVEIYFGNDVAPSLLVEELECNFLGEAAWTVRRTGLPDMVFSSSALVQVLSTKPALHGRWLFFVNHSWPTVGVGGPPLCVGGPPLFSVDFRLVCGH